MNCQLTGHLIHYMEVQNENGKLNMCPVEWEAVVPKFSDITLQLSTALVRLGNQVVNNGM